MILDGTLYWITGLSGAGKTTIGNALYYELKKNKKNVILLDGDILKQIVGNDLGYTNEDRLKRAKRYAYLCKTLTDQGMIVICCTIAMFDEVREWNRDNNRAYVEVFLDVNLEILKERDQRGLYSKLEKGEMSNIAGIDISAELPKHPDILLNNDGSKSVKECVNIILNHEVEYSSIYNRDTVYWNDYYNKNLAVLQPSRFAQYALQFMKAGNKMLEVGCGNGRDSIFFSENSLDVTAVDASDQSICTLQEKYSEYGNLMFVCDDFVTSKALYMQQYHYCYSRFSIHAISSRQQKILIKNVFDSLKSGGKFFIEVRSIHDPLFGKGEKIEENAYIYNGHFRRFIVKHELEQELIEVGFRIEYSEENKGFAPYEDEDPIVLRIIAQK